MSLEWHWKGTNPIHQMATRVKQKYIYYPFPCRGRQSPITGSNIRKKYVDSKNDDLVKQALRYEQSRSNTIENSINKNINAINSYLNNLIPLDDIPSNKQRNSWNTPGKMGRRSERIY